MDLSSHPNSLIRMQACRSHHPRLPWTTYLRRNDRAMAFPGVDSVIGSNSGLVWLRAVLRHGQLSRTLPWDLSLESASMSCFEFVESVSFSRSHFPLDTCSMIITFFVENIFKYISLLLVINMIRYWESKSLEYRLTYEYILFIQYSRNTFLLIFNQLKMLTKRNRSNKIFWQ